MQRKRIRIILFSMCLIILCSVIAVFLRYRFSTERSVKLSEVIPPEAKISVGKVTHTAMREGKKEWTIKAESAHLLASEKKVTLYSVKAVFYPKNGESISLTAKKGSLDTENNDVEVSDNVVIKNKETVLETAKLNYIYRSQTVFSDTSVIFKNNTDHLRADSMIYETNKDRIVFKGNVKAVFDEDFEFL